MLLVDVGSLSPFIGISQGFQDVKVEASAEKGAVSEPAAGCALGLRPPRATLGVSHRLPDGGTALWLLSQVLQASSPAGRGGLAGSGSALPSTAVRWVPGAGLRSGLAATHGPDVSDLTVICQEISSEILGDQESNSGSCACQAGAYTALYSWPSFEVFKKT